MAEDPLGWARAEEAGQIIEPPETKKDRGWNAGKPASAEFMNWWMRQIAEALSPIGGIQPVGGTFSLANNGGVFNQTGVVIGSRWKECDGSEITDTESPFVGRFIPKIDDGRFLRGHSTAGTIGGQTTLPNHLHSAGGYTNPNHTHTDNFTLPNHKHTLSGNDGGGPPGKRGASAPWGIGYDTSSAGGPNTYMRFALTLVNVGDASAVSYNLKGNSGNPTSLPAISGAILSSGSATITGNSGNPTTSPNIEPVYLSVNYYMRIK